MKPREIKRLTATLKAIADPTRRAIFDLVWHSQKKESISTITKEFKITRQGITKHLKILSQGDLIELKRIGRVTYCYANSDALERAENWIEEFRNSVKQNQDLTVLDEIEVETMLESTGGVVLENSELAPDSKETTTGTEEEIEIALIEPHLVDGKPELLQMSIDPNDPGTPVKEEPVKEEPVVKEIKEKPIEVTENQLDIYGVRKEPKLDEEKQQFELF